ncbi:MAG: GNAT family N-acetyltransferase [Lachnospiraceae bacterium]
MVFETRGTEEIEKLFAGWEETLIRSCLQGVMGQLFTTAEKKPVSAMALLGDFSFFAGKPDEELVRFKPERRSQEFLIMIPSTTEWADLICAVYGEKAKKVTRYAIKKEPDVFDKEKLRILADQIPEGYVPSMMDERLFAVCKETGWCRDLVSQFETYEMYRKWGLGVVLLKDGKIVSGASSYSGYRGGIEIEIDTEEKYRRRGFATICGARLILECLDRGLYPSWDAQNLWSVALAEKLGYHFDHEYEAFEIWGY